MEIQEKTKKRISWFVWLVLGIFGVVMISSAIEVGEYTFDCNENDLIKVDNTNKWVCADEIIIVNATIQEDLNVIGNFTGNQIYAGMWFYNESGSVIDLPTPKLYENITNGFQVTSNNGFFYNDTLDYLETLVNGTYKVDWSISFSGGNNNLYGLGAVKNFNINISRNCYSQRSTSSNLIGSIGGTCLLNLVKGDTINFQIDDEANPTADAKVYEINVVVLRLGD